MPEEKAAPKKKQGIHGWRAFFLMFGCGTTAALLIIGVFVGAVHLLTDTVTGPAASDGRSSLPSREPRESMKPGLLDLCGAMDDDVLNTGLYPRRQDEESSPPDSATLTPEPSSGFRTVEDECSWLISPDGLTDWRLELSYEAYVESYGDTSVRDRAEIVMKSIEDDYVSKYGSDYESPGKSTWGDRATVFYMPGEAPGGAEYSVIMRKKGVVCELSYKPVEDEAEADEEAFQAEADPAARALADEIHFLLPD